MERKSSGIAFGTRILQRVAGAEHEKPGDTQTRASARQSHNDRTCARWIRSHRIVPWRMSPSHVAATSPRAAMPATPWVLSGSV